MTASVEVFSMINTDGFHMSIGICHRVLQVFGLWTDPRKTESLLVRGQTLVLTFIIASFVNIPQTILVTRVWGDLNAVIDVLVRCDIPSGISLIKMLAVWYNKDVLGQLTVCMDEDWKSLKTREELKVMWKNAKLSRWITIILILLCQGSLLTYAIFEKRKRQISLGNNGTKSERRLFINADYIYDTQKTPQFEIIVVCQVLTIMSGSLAFAAVDSFFAVLVLHLCSQLNNLTTRIKYFLCNESARKNGNFMQIISTIVVRHEYLNGFANAIEDAFNIMFLAQVTASCMMICLQGYQLIGIITGGDGFSSLEFIFMLYYIIAFVCSLFLYCYLAEVLQAESLSIGSAVYECNWYDFPPKESKILILLLVRTKDPLKLTAGKFAVFSMELYCNILKSSGGYLSMLLALKDRLSM